MAIPPQPDEAGRPGWVDLALVLASCLAFAGALYFAWGAR